MNRFEGGRGQGMKVYGVEKKETFLEYGKMSVHDYCPHGFGTKTPRGIPVICGLCSPEAYEKRMKELGKKAPKISYRKVVLAR